VIDKAIRKFEYGITIALLFMMALIVLLSTIELARVIVLEIVDGPVYLTDLRDIIGFLGLFLVILIALELMQSVWVYMKDHTVHIKVMFEIAIIAVTRKIILLEPGSEPLYLMGIAALVIGLAGGYYFVVRRNPGPSRSGASD